MNEKIHLQDIPEIFYSFHSEKPFKNCIECERDLMEDGCEYIIEKAIRNYTNFNTRDVIFDYAICLECAGKMHQQLSEESSQNIREYFAKNLDIRNREKYIREAEGNVQKLTERCMIKDTAARESEEYQIYAYCIGNKISLEHPPYMISGKVLDEVAELISAKTRDTLNGFFDKHFSPDPSLMSPLPRPKVVLL